MQNGFHKMNNVIEDLALAVLSHAEYKMFKFIYRKTVGWNKEWDTIGPQQFQEGAGISRSSVFSLGRRLEGNGWIRRKPHHPKTGLPWVEYSVGARLWKLVQSLDWSIHWTSSSLIKRLVVVQSLDGLLSEVVQPLDSTKDSVLKTLQKTHTKDSVCLAEEMLKDRNVLTWKSILKERDANFVIFALKAPVLQDEDDPAKIVMQLRNDLWYEQWLRLNGAGDADG